MSLQIIKNGREKRGGNEEGRREEEGQGRGSARIRKKNGGENRIIEQGMGKKWNKKSG